MFNRVSMMLSKAGVELSKELSQRSKDKICGTHVP